MPLLISLGQLSYQSTSNLLLDKINNILVIPLCVDVIGRDSKEELDSIRADTKEDNPIPTPLRRLVQKKAVLAKLYNNL